MRAVLASLVLTTLVAAQPAHRDDPSPVKVTVIVIAASTTKKDVDEKLKGFAEALQKTNPEFTGFQIIGGQEQRVKVGETGTYALEGTEELKIKLDRARNPKDGSIGLTVFPPGAGEISYSCTSGKFVPFVTEVSTKGGDKILVAVMARPVEPRRKK